MHYKPILIVSLRTIYPACHFHADILTPTNSSITVWTVLIIDFLKVQHPHAWIIPLTCEYVWNIRPSVHNQSPIMKITWLHLACRESYIGQVRRSVPNLSLLVVLCLVFVGGCIGKVINFKSLFKNINADASNMIGKAKFVVAVVGPVTHLSTDAALESHVPEQSPGSGNTNFTVAIANLCHSLTSHHACIALQATFYFLQSQVD